ncbi:MAG: isoprenylcysteine carboxylmethyltransferase family protein [Anaerolineae bacterium]|nr:isoprenylcysteine carboxylmethyltransferase family protein [Anaerolineae bacterium]
MSTKANEQTRAPHLGLAQVVIRNIIFVAVQGGILFASAGRLDWGIAWVFLIVHGVVVLIPMLVIDPDLAVERVRVKENVKGWDKALTIVMGPLMFAILIVAGLDQRNGWSPEVSLAVPVGGLVVLALSYVLTAWAMASNKFFARFVRIQKDRGHTVASGGPYRYVRHPGYVAMVALHVAMPLALGSLWALVPGGLVVLLIILRTALEDKMLREELDGYTDYARRVRYRLLLGVW